MKSDGKIPMHVAVIMDGNGRWAKKRLMPRIYGHREGVKTIDKIAEAVFERGIKYFTVFAFSTENWKRPQDEVNGLLGLFKKYLAEYSTKLEKNNIAFRVYGDLSRVDEQTRNMVARQSARLPDANKVLGMCFNYGGRRDIVDAVNKLVESGTKVDEQSFSQCLYTGGIPDPDIIIRTGGETRISNFLLYQSAYSEIYFTDTLWPDFTPSELDEMLTRYAVTDRRYGSVH